jgi:putative peptide zinc metalloprotease protein
VSTPGKNYQLTGLTRAVLSCFDAQPLTLEQIREKLHEQGIDSPPDRLEQALERLVRLSILSSPNSTPPVRHRPWTIAVLHRYMTLKLNLLPASRIAPLTGRLSVLFSPRFMQWALPLALLLQILFCLAYFASLIPAIPKLDAVEFAWLVTGNYAALLLHELGHASACVANGIRHGPIGFCIYLIYPAFYADVSKAWMLPRSRRAVVDAGGIFMSLLCATACSAIFLATRERVWGLVGILCDITVLWNLNPFIRMDGYWLLSDWLGVQNLMNVNKEVTSWIVQRAFGRKLPVPAVLSPGYRFRAGYAAYYAGFLLFSGYFCDRMIHYLPVLVRAWPDLCLKLAAAFTEPQPDWTLILRAGWHWLFLTLALIGILLLLARILASLIGTVRREVRLVARRAGTMMTEESAP